jgi:hypothetical protein
MIVVLLAASVGLWLERRPPPTVPNFTFLGNDVGRWTLQDNNDQLVYLYELDPAEKDRYFASADRELREKGWQCVSTSRSETVPASGRTRSGSAAVVIISESASYYGDAGHGNIAPDIFRLNYFRPPGTKPTLTAAYTPGLHADSRLGTLWRKFLRAFGIP